MRRLIENPICVDCGAYIPPGLGFPVKLNGRTAYICGRCARGYMKNPTLVIPVKSKKQWEHLLKAESQLDKAGVTFDSGTSFKNRKASERHWELDWSLKGATMRNPTHWLKKYCKMKGGKYVRKVKKDGTILHLCTYATNPNKRGKSRKNPVTLYQKFHGNLPKNVRKVKIRIPNRGEKLIKIGRLTAIQYRPEHPSRLKGQEYRHILGDMGTRILPDKPLLATGADGKGLFIIDDGAKPMLTTRGIIG